MDTDLSLLRSMGCSFLLGSDPGNPAGRFDVVVISPGIPYAAPFVGQSVAAGIPVIGELELGSWTKPLGGYFISFDSLPGCAKAIVDKALKAGLILTSAGATWPYGKDPLDSNIRIAPTYPPLEDLKKAMKLFSLCVKIVSAEKLLSEMK